MRLTSILESTLRSSHKKNMTGATPLNVGRHINNQKVQNAIQQPIISTKLHINLLCSKSIKTCIATIFRLIQRYQQCSHFFLYSPAILSFLSWFFFICRTDMDIQHCLWFITIVIGIFFYLKKIPTEQSVAWFLMDIWNMQRT